MFNKKGYTFRVKLFDDDNTWMPIKTHTDDACFDLKARQFRTKSGAEYDERYLLYPGQIIRVDTGIFLELSIGWEALVRPRSGLAVKGLTIVNSPGTIDAGYRGEVTTIVKNSDKKTTIELTKGMRIAQLAIRQVPDIKLCVVDELNETDRKDKGFGSTGE